MLAEGDERRFWITALNRTISAHAEPEPDRDRLHRLETAARGFAMAMEFGFLLDPEKKLLSIGFSAATNTLDPSCYDLLASEARLASLFAIAKGDVPTRHWFRLGRSATPIGRRVGADLVVGQHVRISDALAGHAGAGGVGAGADQPADRGAPAELWRGAGHSLGHLGIRPTTPAIWR